MADKLYCYDCKECAVDLDGKKRCKNPHSWCYSEETVILPTDTACELFHLSWERDFKKPELLAKVKGTI